MLWASIWMYCKVFLVGGAICLLGQVLVIKTKITTGRILVTFLLIGAVLGSFGLYNYLVEWAGAGATIPISGFGNALVQGSIKAVQIYGLFGAIAGGLMATAGGIAVSIGLSYLVAFFASSKTKKN